MPAFVIFALGQPSRRAMFDTPPVRIGRDASNDIVLNADSVSREHAVFVQDGDSNWVVTCISQTNPIVVDGHVVPSGASVREGSEVLIGSDHLVIFSENEVTAKQYMGGAFLTESECRKCHWTGLVSTLKRRASCPRCGGTEVVQLDEYRSDAARGGDQTTSVLKDSDAAAFWKRMKSAKRSYVERDDNHEPGIGRRPLDESTALEIGTGSPSALRLAGMTVGSARVRWDGRAYVVESDLKFPALKVNGEKVTSWRLRSGDVIEVGSNRFRFMTE
jgi:pSer/pThr/pTyr-binding forkhead associated (FHA) protein